MAKARLEPLQPGEDRRQVFVHPGGGPAAAGSRDADGAHIREAAALGGRRDAGEQHGVDSTQAERFQDIGRTGEVVAVVGKQKFAHYPPPPLPK